MASRKIIGVDFSGSDSDVPWITVATLNAGHLTLRCCEPISRNKLTKRLLDLCKDANLSDAVVAMDFPFSVPDDFAKSGFGLTDKDKLERFGFPDKNIPDLSEAQMPERWEFISRLDGLPTYIKEIRHRLGKDQNKKDRDLAKFRTLPRKWDEKQFGSRAFSPLQLAPIQMFPMTFYGMKMLHTLWTETKCKVPPLEIAERTGPVLLETMPGVALGNLGLPANGYKKTKGPNALSNLDKRKEIIEKLAKNIPLQNLAEHRDTLIFSDDALDSVVAAIVAAMWATDEYNEQATLFHRPEDHKDPTVRFAAKREGGIYAPKRINK